MNDFDIGALSLKEKIGQLIVFGFDATTINDHALRLIENERVGNVILFARNVASPKQLFYLNKAIQETVLKTVRIPAIICIDQEGGMVTRIKQGATFFPGAMTIAASHDSSNSYRLGRYMGRQLKALGINMDLAPSLDINNNPHNPVIGVRSFGDTPDIVMEYGLAYIRGLQETIIATAKHFPGHGDTSVDSHLELPKVDKPMDELKNMELKPFKAAVDDGIKAIMSSHINFPALTENGFPATLSSACLTGLLRKDWNYQGLIITDCMQMQAIQANYTTKEGALMAIEAGADLVCVSHSEKLQTEATRHIMDAVKTGRLSEDVIDDRLRRVLRHKRNLEQHNPNQTYADVKSVAEDPEAKHFALKVVREAMTQVRGDVPDKEKHTLLIASEPSLTSIADEEAGGTTIIKAVNDSLPEFDTEHVSVKPDEKEMDELDQKAKSYEQVILCTYNANIYENQQALIRHLNHHDRLHVIAMRNPYDSLFVKDIDHLALLYEYTPNSVRILIEYLNGELKPQGIPPVKL